MRSRVSFIVAAVLALSLSTGCAGSSTGATGSGSDADRTAAAAPALPDVSDALRRIPAVTDVTPMTRKDDIEGLLGAPDGYAEGAVVHDSRLTCDHPGIECGALVERWDEAGAAERRSEEVRTLQLGMPELGIEHHFLRDGVLLRVWGGLTTKQAEEYAAALEGA